MSLFKMAMTPQFYKEHSVMKGLWAAQSELDDAQTDDERHDARMKITRFSYTLQRLKCERERRNAVAAELMSNAK